MYYGLINILSVSNSFTIINPVKNARVASDLDWSMQYQESNQTTLYTNKDVVRLTLNGYFWEMIVNGSGTYCPDHRFSRITTMIVSQNCSLIRTWLLKSMPFGQKFWSCHQYFEGSIAKLYNKCRNLHWKSATTHTITSSILQ